MTIRRVFIYAKKVEEHIKVAIFISKTPRVRVRKHKSLNFLGLLPLFFILASRNTKVHKHKSLNFFGCSAFILFSDFLQYKSLNFFVFLSFLQRAHCFTCPSFLYFRPFLVRKHKSLNFFGCSAFILFSDFLQYKSLNFFVLLNLLHCAHCFLCPTFCVFVLFWWCNGSIYFLACCMLYAEKVDEHIKAVQKHKSLNFVGCYAFILFSDFSQYKSLIFFVLLNLFHCAHCFLCPAFYVFVLFWWCNGSIYFLACCMQRRWKNTLKFRFLSQKLHEYRFVTTLLKVLKSKDVVSNL
ncbi:hypothetical protein HKD37_02G004522 [Glycine soja]